MDEIVVTPSAPSSLPQYVARLSDRAIQRLVGGNAFLRGRLYARRGAVAELDVHGTRAEGKVRSRSDEPYEPELFLADGLLQSKCACPAWKGATGHCKHVAALIVALRDRERPPKPKAPVDEEVFDDGEESAAGSPDGDKGQPGQSLQPQQAGGSPQTVSVGGKRRRSRRRRGRGEAGAAPEIIVPREREREIHPGRASLALERTVADVWLPAEENAKAVDLEYRVVVRSSALVVTPVLFGTRQAIAIQEALAAPATISNSDRPIFRALARHVSRPTATTAELRGEDAGEVLAMLKGRRVVLDPASMELRFVEDTLRPRLELELVDGGRGAGPSVRTRIVFEGKHSRRFGLASGAWFEGTPGWHLDTTEGIVRPVAEIVNPGWLQRLFRAPSLVHPTSELPRLLSDYIPRVAAALSTDLPDISSVADVIDATPRFALKATGDIVEARANVKVFYNEHEFDVPAIGFSSPLAFQPSSDPTAKPCVIRREVGLEMAAVQELLNLRFEPDADTGDLVARGEDAIGFWTRGITELPADWVRFIPNDLANVQIRDATVSARMRVSSGVDWLELNMAFDSGGVAVDEAELRMCLAQGRRLVKLADGTYAPVDPSKVGEVLERMAEIVASSGGGKKLPLSQAGRVQDLLRLVSDTNVAAPTKDLFAKMDDIAQIDLVKKPTKLKATLRPYQNEGFSWLVFLHNANTGGVLADDMGLGKTLQTISLLCWAKQKEKTGLYLVVAPTSVVPNWQREIEKFAPHLKVVLWQGSDRHEQAETIRENDIVITSYALLRRDEEFLSSLDFKYVILDEAQHIKNPLSATARAAKRIKSDRRLALTGTPIENRLSEFWSIFDFVAPNMLGSLKSFEEHYARPIERGDLPTAQKLGAIVRPFVKRRTKSEVEKDLPSKIEQDMIVPLADEQQKLHKQMMREIRQSLLSEVEAKGAAKTQIQILAALTRLRQVACDPRLLKLPGDWNNEESGKLVALRELVGEAVSGGHRVLVFSQFVEMLKLIRGVLDSDGITYEYLDGSTQDRQARVDRFNSDAGINVFLISLKAGGTGLNLTGADTVIHFDPWWNPAVEDQATDRAHRIGQTKVVTVYRLIAKSTVEEKILRLSAKKRSLVENVFATEGSVLKGLTKADVEDLFAD